MMLKLRYGILFFLAFVLSGCAATGGVPSKPDDLGWERVSFQPAQAEEWQLENGLRVFFLKDDELPLVGGQLFVPGGGLYDPPGLSGLASLTGGQMREGGTSALKPDDLDRFLDGLGAAVGSSFGGEYGSMSFSALAQDFDQVFKVFADVVRKPAFARNRFNLAKRLTLESILRRKDNPETMVATSFSTALYGDGSPYNALATPDSMRQISIRDMRRFHERFVRPDRAILAISGSVSREDVEAAVNKYFASWTVAAKYADEKIVAAAPKLRGKPGVYVLERDFDQASIAIGHLGPARLSEDQYAISVYNRLFGHGGFSSLLFSEIRSKRGLAYSVWGGFSPGVASGTFQILAGTRSTQAVSAVQEILKLIRNTRVERFPEDRVGDAKLGVERTFVFRFDGAGRIVQRRALLKLLGYPEDYDETYLDEMNKITSNDVLDVAKTRTKPEDLVVVIVGKVSAEDVKRAMGDSVDVYRLKFDIQPSIVGQI